MIRIYLTQITLRNDSTMGCAPYIAYSLVLPLPF